VEAKTSGPCAYSPKLLSCILEDKSLSNFQKVPIFSLDICDHTFCCQRRNASARVPSKLCAQKHSQSRIIQIKMPLRAPGIISPPVGYHNHLPITKAQKYDQLVKIITSIRRRCKYVIVSRPELIMMSIGPVHNNEATDDAGEAAGRQASLKFDKVQKNMV
jgi:hypothetical protein